MPWGHCSSSSVAGSRKRRSVPKFWAGSGAGHAPSTLQKHTRLMFAPEHLQWAKKWGAVMGREVGEEMSKSRGVNAVGADVAPGAMAWEGSLRGQSSTHVKAAALNWQVAGLSNRGAVTSAVPTLLVHLLGARGSTGKAGQQGAAARPQKKAALTSSPG